MELEWGAPPPAPKSGPKGPHGNGRLQRFLAALRERPGEWAKYPVPVSAAWTGNNAKRFPDYEWTKRMLPHVEGEPQRYDAYARYAGDA